MDNSNNILLRFGSVILDPTIDEDRAKSTAEMKNYKFNMEEVWPEESVSEMGGPSTVTNQMSTPKKPETQSVMNIPLYKNLVLNNSFNSTLDDTF